MGDMGDMGNMMDGDDEYFWFDIVRKNQV
jgi:hypothetical protein